MPRAFSSATSTAHITHMSEPRPSSRHISAGVILVDRDGRVLMQLRDDDAAIPYPGHWGITGGAAQAGETPEQAARREVLEETGLTLGRIEPFRAYYFQEAAGGATSSPRGKADYELYLFHAPCVTPAEEMVCGEGQELRFLSPEEVAESPIAYNHAQVLEDFFATAAYARYVNGAAFAEEEDDDPLATFLADIASGEPWFPAVMRAIAAWRRPEEIVGQRRYRYLIGGEAFDWLLLAERLIEAAGDAIPEEEARRLLFDAQPPESESLAGAMPNDSAPRTIADDRLRELIGDAKHRAHLNYLYGVIVEEALQYAVELEVSKERVTVSIRDPRYDEAAWDPVYQRIYGEPRMALLRQFREEQGVPWTKHISLTELREFMYWLFKWRVKNQEPARVASDTRKALAQLSQMEAAARRTRARMQQAPADVVEATR